MQCLTVDVEAEVGEADGDPAVPGQPLAEVGVGEAGEDLHVVVGDRVRHPGVLCV